MLKCALLTEPTPKPSLGFGDKEARVIKAGAKERWLNILLCPRHSEVTHGPGGWLLGLKCPVRTVSYLVSTLKE